MIDCKYPAYSINMLKAFGGVCPKCMGTGWWLYKPKKVRCHMCKGKGKLK